MHWSENRPSPTEKEKPKQTNKHRFPQQQQPTTFAQFYHNLNKNAQQINRKRCIYSSDWLSLYERAHMCIGNYQANNDKFRTNDK